MALTANKGTLLRDGAQFEYGVKANVTIFAGALVQANGNHCEKAAKASGKQFLGIAQEKVTGGSADGDETVTVRRRVAAKFKTVASQVPGLGATAYVEDDETVHDTASGRSALGEVVAVDTDGVWVFIP